ncbi:MAG: autotransporter-associated beta strand repeat-containing protein, partial [Verrucomicrobiota bacterium]
ITLSANATGSTGVGIQMDSGSGAVTTNGTKFAIGGNQSWTNNSTNALTVGGTITNSGNSTAYTLTVGGTGNTTLSGIISNGGTVGTLALTKNDAGTLTLNGTNTFTGAITLNSGMIYASSSANTALGSGNLTLNDGTTLDFNSATGVNYSGRNVIVGGNTTIVSETKLGTAGVDYKLGTLSIGANTLNVSGGNVNSGTASVTFNGTTTLTGNTTFNITKPSVGGTTLLTLGAVTNGANTATITGNGSFTAGGVWGGGNGGITLGTAGGNATNGGVFAGTATFSVNNTYTGGLIVNSGTATTGIGAGFGNGTILLGDTTGSNNATLALTGASQVLTNAITVRAGSNGTLAITGLTGALTHTTGNITLNNNLTVNALGSGSGKLILGALSGSGNLSIGGNGFVGGTSNVSLNGNNTAFNGNIYVNSGTVANTGSAIWGNGTIYLGDTSGSNNATLSLTQGIITNSIVVRGGSTGNALIISTQNGTPTVTQNLVLNHDLTLNQSTGSGVSTTYNGTISSNGNFGIIAGSGGQNGMIIVTNNSTSYTGTTTVNSGTLDIARLALYGGNTASWTSSNITVASGATLAVRVANVTELGTLLTNLGGSSGGFLAGSNIGIDTTSSGNMTVSNIGNTGNGNGTLGVTYLGVNSLTMNGTSTFTGAFTIDHINGLGTLYFTSLADSGVASSLGAGSVINLGNGFTNSGTNMNYIGSGSSTSNRTVNWNSGTAAINNNGGGTLVLTGAFNVNVAGKTLTLGGNSTAGVNEIQGAIGNTGGVTVSGSNGIIWQLSNSTSTYTGQTTIGSNGTLNVTTLRDFGTASSLGYGNATSVNGTSTIGFTNATGTNATLNYVGSADSSSNRTIMIASSANNTTGGATVQNNGTGNLTFTGAAFNVAAFVSATANRTLTLGGANAGANVIQGAIVDNTAVTGKIALTKAGAGQWILSGTNTYTGGTTVSNGTLTFLNTAAQPSSGTVNVAAGATLGLGVSGANAYTSTNVDLLFAGSLTNVTNNATSNVGIDTTNGNFTYTSNVPVSTRGLVKLGANTLTLTGNNSYTGATTVSTGTLLVNGSTASGSTVNVSSGATLGGNGTIGGATTVNGNLSPGNSPGLLTFGSTLTLNGTSTTTMEIVDATGRGTTYDAVNVTGLLTYNGTLTLTMASPIANTTYGLFKGALGVDLVSPAGNFAGITFTGGAYTGTWTFNGTSSLWTASSNGQDFSFDKASGDLLVAAVPEPATWALLAFSLTTVMVLRRRRE